MGRHQSAGRKPATGCQERLPTTVPVHVFNIGTAWRSSSPLVYLLQGVPTEGCPVLEDVIERVQGAQLPPLLFMINGWRCQRGLGRRWGGEGGGGRREILLLLRVPGIPAPPLLRSHHHLSSSILLLADLPGHAAQLLQASSPPPLPLAGWTRSTPHPGLFASTAAAPSSVPATTSTATTFRILHQHHGNHCHSNLSAAGKRGAIVCVCVCVCGREGGGGLQGKWDLWLQHSDTCSCWRMHMRKGHKEEVELKMGIPGRKNKNKIKITNKRHSRWKGWKPRRPSNSHRWLSVCFHLLHPQCDDSSFHPVTRSLKLCSSPHRRSADQEASRPLGQRQQEPGTMPEKHLEERQTEGTSCLVMIFVLLS